ncbi:hypothetical protein ABW21_db0203329 [Orbilia brochopaga]|nr:hypothetical protein ABW21_db0203329 [Drechslerella brochopaga]
MRMARVGRYPQGQRLSTVAQPAAAAANSAPPGSQSSIMTLLYAGGGLVFVGKIWWDNFNSGRLDGKISSASSQLDGKIDRVYVQLDGNIDRLSARMDCLSIRMDTMTQMLVDIQMALIRLECGQDWLKERFARLEKRVDGLQTNRKA